MKKFLQLPVFLLLLFNFGSDGLSRSGSHRPLQATNHSFCGTYPGRIHDELQRARRLRQLMELRKSPLTLRSGSVSTGDVGNIAVIEDDGTIVLKANAFDLAGKNLKMTPNGAGAYAVSVQTGSVNQSFGTKLPLTDDDFRQIAFPSGFQFPFFGTNYSSVFINSDGNITFTEGDAAHTDRDLSRFNGGPPRIAALFDDLDPTIADGGIFYSALSDRFQITWELVREFDGITPNTVQLTLFPDGSFELTYGPVAAPALIIGWSPGGNLQQVSLVDFSKSGGAHPTGPIAENFSSQTDINFTALAKKFYQTHTDDYGFLLDSELWFCMFDD